MKKIDQLCNIFIFKSGLNLGVTDTAWKCFRCNLSFKEEGHARIHQEISRHAVTRVKAIVA